MRPYANFAKPGFLSTLSLRRATNRLFFGGIFLVFLSTLSLRRATGGFHKINCQLMVFLSTLSLRRATCECYFPMTPFRQISIHALLAESDAKRLLQPSRPPAFLSTLSLRRATPAPVPCRPHADISIHALLAESDSWRCFMPTAPRYFYPRSPCGERPRHVRYYGGDQNYFYPRSPCGERPSYSQHVRRPSGYFYPRSPCGERPVPQQENGQAATISIHALLAESDTITAGAGTMTLRFLSTLSLRRATVPQQENGQAATISIHALLAESDGKIHKLDKQN